MKITDTIAAISTSTGNSGIGIIRVSGDEAIEIVDKIFKSNKEGKRLINVKSHTVNYGNIVDGEKVLDQVLVLVMKNPHSYTGEDTVEIDCHGGMLILKKVLDLVIKNGAKSAAPGEFTKRAFLNGRLDLSQAEAVMDLINSQNDFALNSSIEQLKGGVSEKIKEIRSDVIYHIAFIESALDDPEHISLDGYDNEISEMINKNISKIKKMIDTFDNGRIMKEGIKTVILGKPNAGKSSLLNRMLGEERAIVTDIEGTTRDTLEENINLNGLSLKIIDTAGIRRKSKVKEDIERYSVIRTVTAVERADVVVIVIDATEGVTEQDAKIAGIAHENGKGIIIAVNKWDAIEKNDKTVYEYTNKVRQILSFMQYAEIMFISAKTGQRLPKLFDMIDMVIENHTMRIETGVVNEIMAEAVAMQQPPSDKGKRLRLYYITQVSVKPPTFVIFVNDKELMHFSYTRYIENRIREAFGFRGTPLRFIIRERKEK